MIDKQKIKIMTKLAIYEQNEGKDDLKIMDFFKSDYVSLKIFKINLILTLFLAILFIINFMMNFINSINKENIIRIGVIYIITWIIVMGISSFVCSNIYKKRYAEARIRIEKYEEMLRELQKMQ